MYKGKENILAVIPLYPTFLPPLRKRMFFNTVEYKRKLRLKRMILRYLKSNRSKTRKKRLLTGIFQWIKKLNLKRKKFEIFFIISGILLL